MHAWLAHHHHLHGDKRLERPAIRRRAGGLASCRLAPPARPLGPGRQRGARRRRRPLPPGVRAHARPSDARCGRPRAAVALALAR